MSSEIEFRLSGRFGDLRLESAACLPGIGVTAIMGPSGSGKTTLLRCLAGLVRADGYVSVGGVVWQDERRFMPTHRRGVGYVFQEASLLPHLSVFGNLRYAAKRAPPGAGPEFGEVVAMLGLSALLTRSTAGLSGGERQRVAIARALLSRPALLLMDEPLSSLDAAGKDELLYYLERLISTLRLAVIYVTHDEREALRLACQSLTLRAGLLSATPQEDLSSDSVIKLHARRSHLPRPATLGGGTA
jgi:molybdate transport system ATP-binding protein